MNTCNNPNCTNVSKQTWKIEFDENIIISHNLCDECAKIIEFTEISNSSFSSIK